MLDDAEEEEEEVKVEGYGAERDHDLEADLDHELDDELAGEDEEDDGGDHASRDESSAAPPVVAGSGSGRLGAGAYPLPPHRSVEQFVIPFGGRDEDDGVPSDLRVERVPCSHDARSMLRRVGDDTQHLLAPCVLGADVRR